MSLDILRIITVLIYRPLMKKKGKPSHDPFANFGHHMAVDTIACCKKVASFVLRLAGSFLLLQVSPAVTALLKGYLLYALLRPERFLMRATPCNQGRVQSSPHQSHRQEMKGTCPQKGFVSKTEWCYEQLLVNECRYGRESQ